MNYNPMKIATISTEMTEKLTGRINNLEPEMQSLEDRWIKGKNIDLSKIDYNELEQRVMSCFDGFDDYKFKSNPMRVKGYSQYQRILNPNKRAKILAKRAKDKVNRKRGRK